MRSHSLDHRQLQEDFDALWDHYERLSGRPLEPDEIEDLAEFLLDE